MSKIFCFLISLLPILVSGQATISGRVLNQADNKPVAYATIFLNNSTIGIKAASDGTFKLRNVEPGKYDVIVSIVGFETYNQSITLGNTDIRLPDIILLPKTIALKEVRVLYHEDPDRQKYLGWFKDEFLGTSQRASDCKILNPQMLDLQYDDSRHLLTASSVDFLEIENNALGYKVKYLLINFSLESGDEKKIYYQGPVLFQELKGSSSQQNRWKKNRQEVYENSPMHFLRATLNNQLDQEGFRVQQYSVYANPERPSDSLINAKIAFYNSQKKQGDSARDSLSFWEKKLKLPKIFRKLLPFALSAGDIITTTDKPGQYALNCDNDGLYVAYSKSHHFHINDQINYLYNRNNTENTLVNFNMPQAFFNDNGVVSNPYSLIYYGVWGRNRVAELLPVDYVAENDQARPGRENLQSTTTAALEKYLAVHPSEKIYLHLDKSYYAAGDTIYFKAYLTDADSRNLSNLSKVLHVELIGPSGKVQTTVQLRADSGITLGDLALPDSIKGGNYTIRAYTQWMRNDAPIALFEKVIPIASTGMVQASKTPLKQILSPNRKLDLQFFPEGGTLVDGIRTKVAFKAIRSNGLGVNVNGVVRGDGGKQVAAFTSGHLGMGCFYFTPKAGETYYATISYPGNITDTIPLPKPDSGIKLAVDDSPGQKVMISIATSKSYYQSNKNKMYTLLIYSGETPTTISCKLDSPEIKLALFTGSMRTGVTFLTLFSPDNEPLCERLIFVRNNDQLNVKLDGVKKNYAKREKVNVKIKAFSSDGAPSAGYFSASVVNEKLVPEIEENADNILSYLPLTSSLKGYIEQPNYYFSDTSALAKSNLDILMLTQGYRRFTWKNIFNQQTQPERFEAQKGIEITGQVTNLLNKPVARSIVTLIPDKGGALLTSETDDKGIFRFTGLDFTDTAHFVLSAVNAKGKNTTKITCFNNQDDTRLELPRQEFSGKQAADSTLAAYVANDRLQQREVLKYAKGKQIMLKQVTIRDKRPDDQYRTQSFAGAGHADQVLHSNDLGYGPLPSMLNGKLRGVTFVADTPYLTLSIMQTIGGNRPKKMLVILDGVEGSSLAGLQSTDVDAVEVLRYASTAIYGMEGGGGVLIITTKQSRKLNAKDITSVGVLPISPVGFYRAREFYSPKYNAPLLISKQPDLRSTIYWKPEIQTDKNGNAAIEYYNADGPGTYKVVIEGIDDKGNLGRVVYRYKVE